MTKNKKKRKSLRGPKPKEPIKSSGRRDTPKPGRSFFKTAGFTVKVILGIFSIVGFVLAIDTLKPNVLIEYASSFVPENQLALPIKVINQSRFYIKVEKFCFQDNISFPGNNFIENNDIIFSVNRKILPGDYLDQLCDVYLFPMRPEKGSISVQVFYKYWILPRQRTKDGKFIIRFDKENIIRWKVEQIVLS